MPPKLPDRTSLLLILGMSAVIWTLLALSADDLRRIIWH